MARFARLLFIVLLACVAGGPPSVSALVVELLERHHYEIGSG